MSVESVTLCRRFAGTTRCRQSRVSLPNREVSIQHLDIIKRAVMSCTLNFDLAQPSLSGRLAAIRISKLNAWCSHVPPHTVVLVVGIWDFTTAAILAPQYEPARMYLRHGAVR